jgi:hypothetical protein
MARRRLGLWPLAKAQLPGVQKAILIVCASWDLHGISNMYRLNFNSENLPLTTSLELHLNVVLTH